MSYALLNCLADYGPAAVLTLVALLLEQRRDAPNGTDPAGNIVHRVVAGGLIVAVGAWLIGLAMALVGAAPLGFARFAWMFALGEAIALLALSRSRVPRQPIDM